RKDRWAVRLTPPEPDPRRPPPPPGGGRLIFAGRDRGRVAVLAARRIVGGRSRRLRQTGAVSSGRRCRDPEVAMLAQVKGFIPWSVVERDLCAARTIWLATARPDGRPHAVPVWFVWLAGAVYTISRRDLQKAVN